MFADTLLAIARQDRNVLVVTSDLRGSGKLVPFSKALPSQIVEVGIAEQNLVGIAAGLASAGKCVFAVSPACFLTARGLEQIKNDVAYSDRPVKLIGISAGVSYGALGSTHHSLHDYAALRAIHNISVVAPADNFEAQESIRAAQHLNRPIYIRFGKSPLPDLHSPEDTQFEIGKGLTVRNGSDLTIIGTGEPVSRALMAAEKLSEEGISCRVISMHTVKPLDEELVFTAAMETQAIITVEEHSAFGGLGEACASVLMQHELCVPFKIVGIPDVHTVSGSQNEILDFYGISADGLAETARQLLRKGA